MRRFRALLIMAGLVAAPVGAAAGPSNESREDHRTESVTWSMGKGRLGMTVMGLTPELRTHFGAPSTTGMLVGTVDSDSPAAKAGVRVGDVLTSVRAEPIDDAGDVRSAIAKTKRGGRVELEVIRNRSSLRLEATLADDPLPNNDSLWPPGWLRDLFDALELPQRPTAPTKA
jgi:serine protease Do